MGSNSDDYRKLEIALVTIWPATNTILQQNPMPTMEASIGILDDCITKLTEFRDLCNQYQKLFAASDVGVEPKYVKAMRDKHQKIFKKTKIDGQNTLKENSDSLYDTLINIKSMTKQLTKLSVNTVLSREQKTAYQNYIKFCVKIMLDIKVLIEVITETVGDEKFVFVKTQDFSHESLDSLNQNQQNYEQES